MVENETVDTKSKNQHESNMILYMIKNAAVIDTFMERKWNELKIYAEVKWEISVCKNWNNGNE